MKMSDRERLVEELARAMLNEDYRDLPDDSADMGMLRTRAQRIVDSGIIARERLDEHRTACRDCITTLTPGEAADWTYCPRGAELARAAKGEL